MSQIEARLFGGLELSGSDGVELVLNGRKVRALLGLLLVEADRWHTRDRLTGLLWGDRADTQARNSLNQALYEIRRLERAAGVCLIERETDRIRLKSDGIDCHLRQFETRIQTDPVGAAELHTGILLEGYDTIAPTYSDWLNEKRSQVEGAWRNSLRKLVSSELEGSASDVGISAARLLIELDPLDEAARRSLMLLLARTGNRAEALRQYEICRELLKVELGVEPDAASQELFQQIRTTQVHPTPGLQVERDESQDLIDTPTHEDRPVVAVMPFANLDDDPAFAFMVDGMTQDIVFALSAFRSLRVLAHTATFRMRDADLDHAGIRRILGASYAVGGRVRRSGGRLRISVELFDCRTGEQIWANQYDSPLSHVFEIEESISRHIAAAIEPSLEAVEIRRVLGQPPETLEAYELLLRGYWHLYRRTPQDLAEAWRFMHAAADKDPTYATAYAGLGFLKYLEASSNFAETNYLSLMKDSRSMAEQALEVDPYNPRALTCSAMANTRLGKHEIALETINRSIELCPSFYLSHSALAFACDFFGDFSDAKSAADETIRLRPHDPLLYRCIISKSIAEYQTADYDRAERITRDSLRTDASWWNSRVLLAASLAKEGRLDEARETVDRIRQDHPGLTLEVMLRRMPFADPQYTEHLSDGIVQAGWRD